MADDERVDTDAVRSPVSAAVAATGATVLAEYRRRRLELADLIRAVMNVAAERHDEEKESAARGLLARLAEDRFQLAVVGQFSRGKSTLMNAVLGRPYLPMEALPMTSVVTSVRCARFLDPCGVRKFGPRREAARLQTKST
jgi:predicted GTPase